MFNMNHSCKGNIDLVKNSTVIKQQWLLIQQQERYNENYHDVTIKDITTANKKRTKGA